MTENKSKSKVKKIGKILLKVFLGILILFVLLILGIRSQWGQQLIIDKLTDYVASKTNTTFTIEKAYLTFSGNLYLEDLYLEDQLNDTLLYSHELEASIGLIPLIKGNAFNLNYLEWNKATAKIRTVPRDTIFNYQFLIDAFATQDTTETTTESKNTFEVNLKDLNFSTINLVYKDSIGGIDLEASLGKVQVYFREFDLENYSFDTDKISLIDSKVIIYQQSAQEEEEPEEDIPLPIIKAKQIDITNTSFKFNSTPLLLDLNGNLNLLSSNQLAIDLKSQTISIDALKSNTINLNYTSNQLPENKNLDTLTSSEAFEWPEWKIKVNDIRLDNNQFNYEVSKTKDLSDSIFDPNHIKIRSLDFVASQINYSKENASASIERFNFRESSAVQLQEFNANLKLTDQLIQANQLLLKINNSKLSGDVRITYDRLNTLINNPQYAELNLNLPEVEIQLRDLEKFSPELFKNRYLDSLANSAISANLNINGKLNALAVENTRISWGDTTKIELKGTLLNSMDYQNLAFENADIQFQTSREDINKFVNKDSLGIRLPENLSITSQLNGTLKDLNTQTELNSSLGKVSLDGNIAYQDRINIDIKTKLDSLQLGTLLQIPEINTITATVAIDAEGSSVNNLNAKFNSDFDKLGYSNYDFSALKLDGEITNGSGKINANFKDENLNLVSTHNVKLDSVAPIIKSNINVIGADLQGLKLSNRDVKTQFKLDATLKGNIEDFTLQADIDQTTIVAANEPYAINTLNIKAASDKKNTDIKLKSDVVDLDLKSNASIDQSISAIQKYVKHHLTVTDSVSKKDTVRLKLDVFAVKTPVLTEVLLPGLQEMDTVRGSFSFSEANQNLQGALTAPQIRYNNSILDSLYFNISGDESDLSFSVGLEELSSDPILIKKTNLTGALDKNKILLHFEAFDDQEKMINIRSDIGMKNDSILYHIQPDSLMLNKKLWNIKDSNLITMAEGDLEIQNFVLSNNQQNISVKSDQRKNAGKDIIIDFDNFKLSALTSYLNPDENLVSGSVNGSLTIEEPNAKTGLKADIKISDVAITEIPVGTIDISGKSIGNNSYDFQMDVSGKDAKINIEGSYLSQENNTQLDIEGNISTFKIKTLERFFKNYISETSGALSGQFSIGGSLSEPTYNGTFNFKESSFVVNELGTQFTLPEETINITNDQVKLTNFDITDENQNTFSIDGLVKTTDLTNPEFDLRIKTKNFQILDANKEDNELFYGKVKITANADITGDLNVPVVRGDLSVDEGSNYTLVVPETELEIREREGVVLFVNRENPDAILTRVEDDASSTAILKGYDIRSNLKVGKGTTFRIVIDERTNDNLQVSGSGELRFGMEPNGRMNLSGRYEVKDGHYEANLYNLVKRRFKLQPGGSITWLGDPLEAKLDVTAIYEVETSAYPIMPGGQNTSVAQASSYNQELPFLVYLNVDGELLDPQISFNLDLPEEDQGYAGGDVYNRVQTLNNQEEELNKQVFSLLVLKRFFPASGSDGSSGGAASIARDNVNKVLSGQLNNFSDKLIGKSGIELDFGLNSFTDYEGENPQDRTQLEINAQKRLFNNRLIVQVGSDVDIEGSGSSGEGTPVIGNVSLEYLLTENGRYRLKGFRKNEFESVIDGQLIVTGIALIFTREFNKFRDLFSKAIREEEEDGETTKKDAKN